MYFKTKPQVNVVEPCHEDWNKMTPEAQGRFCGSCSKIVVDFSNMSDQEIISFFEQSTGKTCGRFTKDQLARPLEKESNESKAFLQKWLIAAVLSGILVLSPGTNMAKMTAINDVEQTETVHGGSYYIHALPEFVEFEGVVTHQGEPLSRVAIYIVSTDSYVFTKRDGSFSFRIKSYDYQKSKLATFSKKGFEDLYRNLEVVRADGTVELEITKENKSKEATPKPVEVQLEEIQMDSNQVKEVDSTEVTAVGHSDGILQPSKPFEIVFEPPMIDPGYSGGVDYTPLMKIPVYDVVAHTKSMFRYLFE